jgi:hypothetical protein
MGWEVGWHTKRAMHASQAASAVLVSGLLVCKALGMGHSLLAPFQLGVSVMGAHCFFLTAFIRTSSFEGESN